MFCRSHRWGKFPWFFPQYFIKKEISTILSCCFFTLNGVLKECLFNRERYLGTLLQVEGMLKTWFPHITAQKSSLGSSRYQLTKVRTCKTAGRWGNKETKCTCKNGVFLLFSLENGFLFRGGNASPSFIVLIPVWFLFCFVLITTKNSMKFNPVPHVGAYLLST